VALVTTHPDEPLRYPAHYPPTNRWQRFFIGVRWLGPDLSFFKDLRSAQASRTRETIDAWGGHDRQLLATEVGIALAMQCGWPTPFFVPDDHIAVIVGGPMFAATDVTDVSNAIGAMEEIADVKMGAAFWEASGSSTLGDLVDQLLAAAGPDNAFKSAA
jgi:hypothetical protein